MVFPAIRLIGAVLALLLSQAAHAQQTAPEIARPGLAWFNVPAPLPIQSLRGRVVILDFWTLGCVNCIHMIPILWRIEQKYPEQVVVIGVHSPKFKTEKSARSVQDAIRRHGIHHPVVHDPEMSLWKAYDVRAWPTLVFIGVDGSVLGRLDREPDAVRLEKVIDGLVTRAGKKGFLKPARLDLTPLPEPKGRFEFPGKLKPIPGNTKAPRWALADSGHHQIVILDDQGAEMQRFGSGMPGAHDGAARQAAFNRPQGLIATAEAIYVADTENHRIRRVDLESGVVSTLAGTGSRGHLLGEPLPALGTALASPWDLEIKGQQLYFANAGTHQIGVLDLSAGTVARLAGSGKEALTAGSATSAAFAQPSGLALSADGSRLYVADSESSAIRVLSLDRKEVTVRNLVGAGLFEFGREDGKFELARLQHPLGLAVAGERVLVADTYNSTIRTLHLRKAAVTEFDGGAYTCQDVLCIPLREPAGIATDGPDRVLVVDSGNHRVEEYRPSTQTYRTWAH